MPKGRPLDVERELLEAFVLNGRATEYLVSVLPDRVWRVAPPAGRGRTIAAIVVHIQSVRRMFARMGGARQGLPSLDRNRAARADAIRALRQSTDILVAQFEEAIRSRRVRVKGMPRRVVNMLLYLVEHDAHHRGQIVMLAKDLGHEFRSQDTMRLWGWKRLPSDGR